MWIPSSSVWLRQAPRALAAVACCLLASCGNPSVVHKVYPVKGKILVNGQPANECQILLNRNYEDKHPVTPMAMTNENGEFEITTYYAKDGAPEGEYIATITWRERSGLMKGEFEGVDRLDGAYATTEKTKNLPGFVVKVERQPVVLPTFELKQSAVAKRRAEDAKKQKMDFHGPLGGVSDK